MTDPHDAAAASCPPSEDLLSLLDADPLRAQAMYRDLARQLQRFLGYDCRDADDAMQEVFARGFRRVREGVDMMDKGPRAYFFGIARNIIKEQRKPSQRREQQLDDPQWDALVSKAREAARMEATIALKEYLGRLRPLDAELLVRYCQGEADALMHEYGLSAGSLRVTVFRIREQLRAWRDAAEADRPGAGAARNERPAGDMEQGGDSRRRRDWNTR